MVFSVTKSSVLICQHLFYNSDSESETSFTFSEENGVVSATASNDLKFFEASKFNAKLNVNHNRTPSTLNHSGSFEFDFGGSNMKLTWNAGSSSQMCETEIGRASCRERV
mgnify:FL=1